MRNVKQDADVVSSAQTEFVEALDGFLGNVRAFTNAVDDAGYGWDGRARSTAVGKGVQIREDGDSIIAEATELIELLGISKDELIVTEDDSEQTFTNLV